MKKKYSLYLLICPNENIVKYIGITSRKVEERLYEHLRMTGNNPHKNNWIKKLLNSKKSPKIKVIFDGLTEKEACNLEIKLIKQHRKLLGKKLTNISEGGNLPPSQHGTKRIFTKQHKKNISKAAMGRVPSNKGKKMTEDQRGKLSIAGKKLRGTKEWKKLRSTWSTAKIKAKLFDPNGKEYIVDNINLFSKEHGIDSSSIYKVLKKIHRHHKGWTGEIIN